MTFKSRPLLGAISEDEAKTLIRNYKADERGLTRSVWFSIEQLAQLSALLTAESLVGANTDGIRIYFAKYPDTNPENSALPPIPKEYLGQNTIVFVSTQSVDGDEDHHDYFLGLQMQNPSPAGQEGTHQERRLVSAPENRGELCKPSCKGTFDGPN